MMPAASRGTGSPSSPFAKARARSNLSPAASRFQQALVLVRNRIPGIAGADTSHRGGAQAFALSLRHRQCHSKLRPQFLGLERNAGWACDLGILRSIAV